MQAGDLGTWALVGGGVVSFLGNLGSAVWIWRMRAEFAARRVVDGHTEELGRIQERLKDVEDELDTQPDREALSRDIVRVEGEFKVVRAEIIGDRNTLSAQIAGIESLLQANDRSMAKALSGIGHQVDSLRNKIIGVPV